MKLLKLLLILPISLIIFAKPIIDIRADFLPIEKKLGHEFLQLLTNSGQLVEDIEVVTYLSNLGQSLVRLSHNPDRQFAFYTLNDDSINAFAGPGGYIGIHTGLILNTDHETELASVLAHEIAHITQNHLVRHQQKTSKQPYLITAAIVASLLTNSTELGQAIIGTTLAGTIQSAITFTREHEQEADDTGLEIIQKSLFNPRGLGNFFTKLKDEKDAIEYLRTHPLSLNRISHSLQSLPFNTPYTYQDSFKYQSIKQRLYYWRFERINTSKNKQINLYMKAYRLFAQEKYTQAKQILTTMDNHPYITTYLLKARTQSALNMHQEANKSIELAQAINPDNEAVAYYKALIEQNAGQTKQAISHLKYFANTHRIHYQTEELLAKLYLDNQQIDRHHIAQAFSLVKQGKHKKALFQLKRAKSVTGHADLRAVINAHIMQVKRLIALLQ